MVPDKKHAKIVMLVFGAGLLLFAVFALTPLRVPCVFKSLAGLPCPGCGLTRAVMLAGQFDLTGAVAANILFLPLTLLGAAYFVCAFADLFFNTGALARLSTALKTRWVIVAAFVLMSASWVMNVLR